MFILKVQLLSRWFPKAGKHVESGDWQKVQVKVIECVENKDKEPIPREMVLVGNMVDMQQDGSIYKVYIETSMHEKYGLQYNVKYSQEIRSFDSKQQKRNFLNMFLSERQINSLFEMFEDPIQLLEMHDIEKLCQTKGIGEKTANKMIERYEACKDYGPAYGELGAYGLTPAMIKKLIDRYGSPDTALSKVQNNPYLLASQVDGVGFSRADAIALETGIGKHDLRRVIAFIKFYMHETANNTGSSYMTYDELLDALDEQLGTDLPQEVIDEAMQQLVDDKTIWYTDRNRSDEYGEYIETIIALTKNYETELSIAKNLFRLIKGSNNIDLDANEVDDLVKPQETRQRWNFTERQKEGIKAIINSNVVIIRGYAGTGKSSTVAGLLSCLDESYRFKQCALSGKASVNLRDITGKDGSTIHTLLGVDFEHGGFKHNESKPLETDMVILDEASMVDINLFNHLIKAIPTGAKFILLGDTNQLESIGVGNILLDMIDSELVPCITFDEIHRQGAKSGIIPFSIEIAQGKTKYKDSWVGTETLGELKDLTIVGYKHDQQLEERESVDLIVSNFKKLFRRCKDISEIAVILPTKSSGTGCYKINQLIQDIVLPERRRGEGIELGTKKEPFTVYKGDKIINLQNNYTVTPNIFNGNMGEVIEVDATNKQIVVDFYNIGEVVMKGDMLNNIALGYSITCHKGQGSTIPYVIYCIDYSHFIMLNRQQLYTGITRAKKHCILIAETKALNKAIRTNHVVHKRTFLYHFLCGNLKF